MGCILFRGIYTRLLKQSLANQQTFGTGHDFSPDNKKAHLSMSQKKYPSTERQVYKLLILKKTHHKMGFGNFVGQTAIRPV